MPDAPRFTDFEKLKALKREIGKREHAYPRLVADGKMTFVQAQREIEIMKSIGQDYEELAAKERLL